jgi:opacity protein-like surface antigen
MGSLKTLALAGAVLAGATAVASAADLRGPAPVHLPPAPIAAPIAEASGWYLRGDIGIGQMNGKFDLDQIGVGSARGTHESFGTTLFGGLGVGYQFNSWLRADVTGEYRGATDFRFKDRFCFDAATGGGCPFGPPPSGNGSVGINSISGKISSTVALANAYLDLGTWHGLTPFVGVGLGFAQHKLYGASDIGSVDFYAGGFGANATTFGTIADKSKTNFAWALHAGVGYDVTPGLKLELAYRYLHMGSVTSGASACGVFNCQTPTYVIKAKELDAHDFRIGMRWMLGGPVASAPMPYPAHVTKKF